MSEGTIYVVVDFVDGQATSFQAKDEEAAKQFKYEQRNNPAIKQIRITGLQNG